ncbi:MAG: LysM peptidoglycan-binding domain-containing protein [Chloroflexota bacterium]
MKRTATTSWTTAAALSLAAALLICVLSAGLAALDSLPVQAAPPNQIPIYTPTPGPDGRIIYIVRANDTLMGISLIMGVPVEKLRELNDLTTDTIFEGQKLLLGLGGPAEATPTAGPAATPTPVEPTPTPKPGQGTLCILLFNDLNGNSIREADEPSLPNGAISFGNRAGTVSQAIDSGAGEEHQCFENLPEGEYTISVAVPDGYNPTTTGDYELPLKAGDETYINFGAQANTQTLEQAPVIPEGPERSPLLGLIGGGFLLAGAALAFYAWRMLRR